MGRLKLFLPLVAFLVLGGLLFRGLSLDPTALPSALINEPVPPFELPALGAEALITQDDLKGRPMLLNVWATWCYSCRVEHPYLLELARSGISIIGLNYKDDATAALKWLGNLGDPYTVTISDTEGTLGIDLGVYGAPETYVIDASGRVRYRHVGVVNQRVWEQALAPFFVTDKSAPAQGGGEAGV
jgi:cytochrome c biogenesis protein CcmG/thiol:disulfide interchange protein DsbE